MWEPLTASRVHVAARSHAAKTLGLKGIRGLISDASAFQGLRPQCPRCRANINQLECQFCGLRMQINFGIVRALPEVRARHYAGCIEHCERNGTTAGTDMLKQEYYLSLPYKDLSGRESEAWRIRAHNYSYLVEHVLNQMSAVDGGRILDLGAGNCWMSFRLALARYRPIAVDVHTCDRHGLGAGEHFRMHLPAMFPRFQAELTHLPFQDGQFDAVVFNSSLQHVDDYKAAFREAFRCTRSGGMVIVCHTPGSAREKPPPELQSHRRPALAGHSEATSNSIESLEYVLEERLLALERHLHAVWTVHSPWYGFLWSLRPLAAKLLGRHEPSRFRIYAARKP